MSYLGKEVMRASALSDVPSITTEYSSGSSLRDSSSASDSQYVSSVEGNTPFPSLTLSKKFELEKYINNGQVTYNISTFSEPDVIKPDVDEQADKQQEEQQQEQKQDSENSGCCLLL